MGFIILACFAAALSLVLCNQNLNIERHDVQAAENIMQPSFAESVPDEHKRQRGRSDPTTKKRPTNLKLAAFNVQTFGRKKMATPGVPELLVKVGVASVY